MGGHSHLNSACVQEAIDEIGFGPFQLVMLLMTGGMMFAEGAEVLIMGTITTLLRDHWGLSALLRGSMVAIVFIGFAIGNLISGYIGDRYGRRPAILLAYALIGTFGFLTGLAWHPGVMVALRFCVGLGCGIGFPSVYSIIPELCPTAWRGPVSTLMIGFMPIGELYAALMVLLVDPDLTNSLARCDAYEHYPFMSRPSECTWRTMCELSAVPAFCFLGASALCLWESPHFLATDGRHDEAREVLEAMARMNGSNAEIRSLTGADGSPKAKAPVHAYAYGSSLAKLLHPPLGPTTMFMFLAHFCKDFSVFGMSYALPQFFHSLESLSVGLHLTIMALLAIPGVLVAFCFTKATCIGHITSIRITAGVCAVSIVGMLELNKDWIGAPCAFVAKSFAMAYFICTVVYSAEVFPTEFRNTAVGLCTSFGRLGSISAPLVFEVSTEHMEGVFDVFLGNIIFLMGTIALTAGMVLTIETKGMDLPDEEAEECIYGPLDGQGPKSYGTAAQ